jgi:hypothetical protein
MLAAGGSAAAAAGPAAAVADDEGASQQPRGSGHIPLPLQQGITTAGTRPAPVTTHQRAAGSRDLAAAWPATQGTAAAPAPPSAQEVPAARTRRFGLPLPAALPSPFSCPAASEPWVALVGHSSSEYDSDCGDGAAEAEGERDSCDSAHHNLHASVPNGGASAAAASCCCCCFRRRRLHHHRRRRLRRLQQQLQCTHIALTQPTPAQQSAGTCRHAKPLRGQRQ